MRNPVTTYHEAAYIAASRVACILELYDPPSKHFGRCEPVDEIAWIRGYARVIEELNVAAQIRVEAKNSIRMLAQSSHQLSDSQNQQAVGEKAPDSPETRQWVTRKQIHNLAQKLSPTAPELKMFKNSPALKSYFRKVGTRKDYLADYQKILPILRENWPEIPWPNQVSSRG